VAAYESLRPSPHAHHAHERDVPGKEVVMKQGLAMWVATWTDLSAPTIQPPPRVARPIVVSAAPPTPKPTEIIHLLTSMVLDNLQQGATRS